MTKKVLIAADSSCDMPEEYIQKHGIKILPFNININNVNYLDRKEITTAQLFEKVEQTHQLPKTSAISPGTYLQFFEKYASEYDIVFIGLGSDFSSSVNSAILASKEFKNVYVVDSLNLSAGSGLLINKAVLLREQGLSALEICEELKNIIPRVRVQFVINTLKYLHMGGRCSGTSRIFGTALKIKPIIKVVDGKMVVAKKPMGYHRGLQALLHMLEEDKDNIDGDLMTITHCLADSDAVYLKEEISKMVDHKNILETNAGAVISTHCGPRCIGILYILKENK